MKTYYLFLTGILCSSMAQKSYSQTKEGVGIGITSPDQSAILHIQPPSDNKGLLIPRLTENEMLNIDNEAEGLIIYNTTASSLYHFSAGSWSMIGSPKGSIMMWSGSTAPTGWTLCDGSNGSPDLRGRFIVSYGQAQNLEAGDDSYSYVINDYGGRNGVLLTEDQTPVSDHVHNMDHGHAVSDPGHLHNIDIGRNDESLGGAGDGSRIENYGNGSNNVTSELATTGISVNNFIGDTGNPEIPAGQTYENHENRPPYYVLAFIMKL